MSPELEQVQKVMLRYHELYVGHYREKWMPTNEHIVQSLQAMKSPMPGFAAYTPEELCTRLDVYFACKDDWVTDTKHNYSVFLKHLHRWIVTKSVTRSLPAQHPVIERAEPCEIHPDVIVRPSEFCTKCFPKCDKCGRHHLESMSCEQQKELDGLVGRAMTGPTFRGDGNPIAIDGTKALTEPGMREIHAIRSKRP